MCQVSDVIRRIQRWIETVDFEEAEKNYLAANLQWAALFTGAGCVLAGGVYAFVIQRPYTVATLLISLAFYLAVVWLVRRRHLTSASALYLSAMLGIVTYELHMANGIRSIGVILYLVVVIFASLILSRRLFLLYVGLVLASVGSVIYGQMQGWVQVATLEPPSFAVFLLYSLILSGTGLVVRMLAESWRTALARAQRHERALAAQKAMLDRVGQAVVGCQSDSTIVYWNQAATDLYGWRAEEAVGRKYYEVVPTRMSPEMTESIRASLRQGAVWSGEMRVQRRDGISVPILGTLAPLHDERGVMTGWVGIAADLAERTRAEDTSRQRADEMSLLYRMGISLAAGHDLSSTLNALQAEISSLIQADAMFIAIYDENTDTISYPVYFNAGEPAATESRRLADRPGLTGAVIMGGKTFYLPDIMTPQVQGTFAPVDDHALILHTFLGVPLVLKERSIGVISVQSSRVDAFTPEQIQLVENIAVHAAITIDKAHLFDQLERELAERKRAEQAARRRADEAALLYDLSIALSAGQELYQVLRSLLEYIRRLFALNSFYVGIYDEEHGILQFPLFWNDGEFLHPEPRDLRVTPGFSGEVILGRRRVYISDLEDPQVVQELQVVATVPSRNRSLVGIPLIAQGRVTGMFSIQSRQANAYTPDQIHLIEALAAQVAIAIDKARLLDQLKLELAERQRLVTELEAKNDELERFTYTVSHDLKAPLVTIRGFAGFLEKDMLAGKPERVKSDMARILEATDKMQRLLNELLDLSRVGRMMSQPQAVSFETIAREAVNLVAGRIVARGVLVEIAPGLPAVYGDRTRLIQVVQNLVDNGCKFMGDQPEPRIEIGMSGADADGKPIFFVRDNGLGIEPQYHERVFGLFNKLDVQTEGTGVGLALVKRIVEVHGGRIWFESELGKGSIFCFTLPTS